MAAARAGAGMAGVQGAVVDQVEPRGFERRQPATDFVDHAHGRVFRKGLTVQRTNTPVAT